MLLVSLRFFTVDYVYLSAGLASVLKVLTIIFFKKGQGLLDQAG